MINSFASLQHINQFNFQSAWEVLSENLKLYRKDYETKDDFVNYADEICNQFSEEENPLSEDDSKAIAGKVWDYNN